MKKIFLILIFICEILFLSPGSADATLIIQRPVYIGLTSGLVGYWDFSGGTPGLDRSGSKFHGTLTNSPSVTPGKIGQGLQMTASAASGDTAPTFIQEAETAWSGIGDKTTSAFDVEAGDVLVAFGHGANWQSSADNITISGGSLDWSNVGSVRINNFTSLTLATAVVDTNKSMQVTFADTSSSEMGGNVLTFRDSDGAGTPVDENGTDGGSGTEPSLNVTTTQANSAIVVTNGDWATQDGGTIDCVSPGAGDRCWRSNAGTLTERTYNRVDGQYTVYGGYHADAGAINTYAVGLSAPVSQTYAVAAVEVKGTAGAGSPGGYLDIGTGPSSVKAVSFWVKPESTTEYFVNLTSTTDYIWLNAGTVTATGFTGPTIYVDGVRTSAMSAGSWHHVVVISDTAENASNLDIGRTSDADSLTGKIDEVRMYNRVLAEAEIRRLYKIGGTFTINKSNNTGTLQSGLAGYWTFDGQTVSGTSAADSSGNKSHGSITNGAKIVPGKIGQGLNPPSTSYAELSNTINFSSTADYTLAAWVKPLNISTSLSLVPYSDGAAASNKYQIYTDGVTGEIGNSVFGQGSCAIGGCININPDFVNNEWQHFVFIRVASPNSVRVYRNGVLVGQGTEFGAAAAVSITRLMMADVAEASGTFDDMRIYNRVLSDAEINRLYKMGK